MTFTRSCQALRRLAPALLQRALEGRDFGLSVIAGPEEAVGEAPYPLRRFEEYSLHPEPAQPLEQREWRLSAARRALLEERPDVLLTSACEPEWEALDPLLEKLGIARSLAGSRLGRPEFLGPLPSPELFFEGQLDGCLSRAEHPRERLRELLASHRFLRFREPVNLAYVGSRQRFGYGEYDNDFALAPPTLDLRSLLRSELAEHQFSVDVLQGRSGTAGDGPYLEACDDRFPLFDVTVNLEGVPRRHWLDRYAAGKSARLQLLLIDYHNVAGSGASLAYAINRYSQSQATVLCAAPHPFIDHAGPYCPVVYAQGGWTDELLALLRASDALLYVEEDNAETIPWPEKFREVARHKPDFSLYVGQRVHRNVAARQNAHGCALVALPHIWRMYPRCRFFAGFYPPVLDELAPAPPRSHQDGILRVLHTPSLPHPTLHRFLYHKDTDAYLDAAQVLKRKHPSAQFLQLAGVPHRRLMQARLDCDVAFHQLRGFHGLSGSEAMRLGRPTVQAFDRENRHRHLEYWGLECRFPWLDATPETLVAVLDRLLSEREYRREVGQQCREFMLEYMRPEVAIVPFLHYCAEVVGR